MLDSLIMLLGHLMEIAPFPLIYTQFHLKLLELLAEVAHRFLPL